MYLKQCGNCGKEFDRLYNNQKFCSKECAEIVRIQRLIDSGVKVGQHNKPPNRKGIPLSEETKRKMSEIKKGKPIPWLNNTTHGDAKTGEHHQIYNLWGRIKQRCLNPNHKRYDDYGGRGISIWSEWIDNYVSFRDYIVESLGWPPPEDFTLDRIDNDGNYEPGNLKWSSAGEQAGNRRWRRYFKKPFGSS